MMQVTFWPILAAAIANIIIGWVWFNPKVFGGSFASINNFTPDQMEKGKRRMLLSVFGAFIAALIIAYVMSFFAIAWQVFDWVGAIELGFWLWLGFTAPPMLGMVLWEMKPFKYYAIVSLQWLVSFIVMAVIIVTMAPGM